MVDFFLTTKPSMHPYEEYADALSQMTTFPSIDTLNLSWNYCVTHKIYANPDQRDAYNETFNMRYGGYVTATLMSNTDLSEDRIVELVNRWPRAVYSNLFDQILLTYPSVQHYQRFKIQRLVSERESRIESVVRVFRTDKIEFDVNKIQEFCKYMLCIPVNRQFNMLIFAMIRYGFMWKHIDIPENAIINPTTIQLLLDNVDVGILKRTYLPIFERKQKWMCLFVKKTGELPPEFIGKLADILVSILRHDDEGINQEAFDRFQDKRMAIQMYIGEYRKAPPEWMYEHFRGYVIDYLKANNIEIPDSLHNYATLACTHYDKDKFYINMDTNEIKCEYCYADFEHKDRLTYIYNIKCLICFEEHPEKLHRFDCGHTLCLECYKRHDKCPLCDRPNQNETNDDTDSDTTVFEFYIS